MPAIQVARTDTFEQQRVKINEIGSQIFNISAGGSDLATGLLKIGDGSRLIPSLSFTNDPQLGVYRPEINTLGIVSSTKNIVDFSNQSVFYYRDLILRKRILGNTNLTINNAGSGYDAGQYTDISLIGGSGELGTVDIVVTEFIGTINNTGRNYNPGTYTSVLLTGGSGSGASVDFLIDPITGDINDGGSAYVPGQYQNVPLTGGSGSGATANITIGGNTTLSGSVTNAGSGYTDNIYSNISLRNVATATYTVTTVANPSPLPNSLYQINGVTQQTLTLDKGNTYRFDISDASVSGHPFAFLDGSGNLLDFQFYLVNKVGSEGTAGSFVDLIILPEAPTETIQYYCTSHAGMGATMSVVSGTTGIYGNGALANFEVVGGVVTNFVLADQGSRYKQSDQLTVATIDVGGSGSGLIYTINSVVFTGTVNDVQIQSSGQNYVLGDLLSASDSDLGAGGGSGFEFAVSSSPGIIRDLNFVSKGSGYQVGDLLALSTGFTGITGDFIVNISGLTGNVTSGSNVVTVASTVGIYSGMQITVLGGSTGDFPPNVIVDQVTGGTTFTASDVANATGALSMDLTNPGNQQDVLVSSTANINQGDVVTVASGSGALPANTTITSINELSGSITLSNTPTAGGPVVLTISPSFGVGTTPFEYEVQSLGSVESFLVNNPGNGYNVNDLLTVAPEDLVQPITYTVTARAVLLITFTTTVSSTFFSVGNFIDYDNAGFINSYEIIQVNTSGSNLQSLLIVGDNLDPGSVVVKQGTSSPQLTVDTSTVGNRFLIDTGSGAQLTPDLTLYVGNTYVFDTTDSSNDSHQFAFSEFRDGIHAPSLVENVSTILSSTSAVITVASTTGILAGMQVTKITGSGEILPGITVESVDSATQITLSQIPTVSGNVVLSFSGVEYTSGVTRTAAAVTIKVVDTTPNLYYYCNNSGATHADMGGVDNQEATVTIDPNNPKTFGSGFQLIANTISSSDTLTFDILDGEITSENIVTDDINATEGTIATFNATTGTIPTLNTNVITSGSELVISPTTRFSSTVNIGSNNITLNHLNGNITTPGIITTNNSLNVNSKLTIVDAEISSIGSNDLELTAAPGYLTKVTGTGSFVIPSGNTLERPIFLPSQGNGAIRFNTTTNQYEGYSQISSSWASLGGVRDTDGNTYIIAEESVTPSPTNDNRLWFYNDGQNSFRFTNQYQEFMAAKRVRSLNVNAPDYTEWAANTPVNVGDYLKYNNDIYEVVGAGGTGTSGNEPNDRSGNPFVNGTATLQYSTTAVGPITFEQVSQINIGPTISVPMVFQNDLRITKNTIATDVTDLEFKPNTGRRIICTSKTHLQIPAGTESEKSTGTAKNGSIRYNTTNQVYEGFSETTQTWGSLGGVKDVDQNTYIIPELGPGTNENILYFFNDNINTLQLTTTTLDFTNINTVSCSFDDSLEITASTVTFDNSSTTIDNTVSDRTFIHTSKDKLDLGLSTGLVVDPLLRLDDQGDVYYNVGFGSGSESLVRIFDKELANLEISKYRITTSNAALLKGTTNNGSAVIYAPSTELSAKVELVAHNTTTGAKEVIEFSVIDNGSDIFYTEVGTIQSSGSLITYTFDFNVNNAVRLNYSLATGVANANAVNVTVVSNVIKK